MTPTTEITKRRTRINLAVDAGPHALLKVAATALGISLDEAYSQAARMWNAAHVKRGRNGGASVPLSADLADEAKREQEIARLVTLANDLQAERTPQKRS